MEDHTNNAQGERFANFINYYNRDIPSVLKQQTNWEQLGFYQKSVVLYQLTFAFCERFLQRWSAEEMANVALTLCHQVDKAMMTHIETLEPLETPEPKGQEGGRRP